LTVEPNRVFGNPANRVSNCALDAAADSAIIVLREGIHIR